MLNMQHAYQLVWTSLMTVSIYPPMLSMQLHMTSSTYVSHTHVYCKCMQCKALYKLLCTLPPFMLISLSESGGSTRQSLLACQTLSIPKTPSAGGKRGIKMGSRERVHHPMAVLARRLFLGPYTVLLIIFASTAAAACPLCTLPAVLMTGCSRWNLL